MPQEMKSLEQWLESAKVSAALKQQLLDLQEAMLAGDRAAEEALTECLGEELLFGTSGLRGKMGAGNHRMNYHTVAKATQGLSNYLLEQAGGQPSVCIAYDSRNYSRLFAETAARVLCGNGIQVWMFRELRPTPMLSFAIREKKASGGIVITASHNPREYNGYKVYGRYGGQITGKEARAIQDHIGECDLFDSPRFMELAPAEAAGLFHWIEPALERSYYDLVKLQVSRKAMVAERSGQLHILYTPLYGAGAGPVSLVLRELGFRVDQVAAQMAPDGDFPTTPFPNPERPAVYAMAQELARTIFPDLILSTDPDCDRFGVMVRNQWGEYTQLTGNQQGLLLCEYLLEARRQRIVKTAGYVYSSIVTTDLVPRICAHYGVYHEETLTGFKYSAEKAEAQEKKAAGSFIYAMEESNGCMAGNFVRDKDAVIGSVLIAEAALYYKEKGMTLLDALDRLYKEYGYRSEAVLSFLAAGMHGQRFLRHRMNTLRLNWQEELAAAGVVSQEDYLLGLKGLPASNVLKYYMEDGSWMAIRPSGTEAKFKIYLSAQGLSKAEADARLEVLRTAAMRIAGEEAILAEDDE
jgi:phosphoglucomutase